MGLREISLEPPGAFKLVVGGIVLARAVQPPEFLLVPLQGRLTLPRLYSSTQNKPWTRSAPQLWCGEALRLGPQAMRERKDENSPGLQAFIPAWPEERRNYQPLLFANTRKATVFKVSPASFKVGPLSLQAG